MKEKNFNVKQTHSALLKIYKELKELQYQQLKAELELVTD
jgi:hypothetical protein